MVPAWDDKFSVHNEVIDDQHKKLFDLARQAYICANKNITKDEMKGLLTEFFIYMKEHFADEELYMQQIGYPYLNEHSGIHKDIVASMSGLIRNTKNINELKENLVLIAEKWLLDHILQCDLKIEEWRRKEVIKGSKTAANNSSYPYSCDCSKRQVTQQIHEAILAGKRFICSKCQSEIKYQG